MHVDISGWLSDAKQTFHESPMAALFRLVRGAHNGLYYSVTSRYPLGTNVFEREWDLLVVLDACRVDAMREVAPEFDFVDEVDDIWSTGSASHEWLCKTFTREHLSEIRDTVLVSTNPHVPPTFHDEELPPRSYPIPLMIADWDVVTADDFEELRQIHNHDYEDQFATVPPALVTDHAIHTGRTSEFERLVVHYFQPHRPYIGSAYPENRAVTDVEDSPWTALKTGAATLEEVWDLYLDNLRLVLSSVERLLENVDAERVAITADHGDLFGELRSYGHPEGLIHPQLKRVPWVETSATDRETSTPNVDVERQLSDADTESRLRALGYL